MHWNINVIRGHQVFVDESGTFYCRVGDETLSDSTLRGLTAQIHSALCEDSGQQDAPRDIGVHVYGFGADWRTLVKGHLRAVHLNTGRVLINNVELATSLVMNRVMNADHPDLQSVVERWEATSRAHMQFNMAAESCAAAVVNVGVSLDGLTARTSTFDQHRQKEQRLREALIESLNRRLLPDL